MASQSSKGGSPKKKPAPSDSSEHLSPGSIVFAKMKSFPPWPAKVITADEYPGPLPKQQIPVLFLGSGDYGHVATKECYPYVEYKSQFSTPKQRAKYLEAIREADGLVGTVKVEARSTSKPQEQEKSAAASETGVVGGGSQSSSVERSQSGNDISEPEEVASPQKRRKRSTSKSQEVDKSTAPSDPAGIEGQSSGSETPLSGNESQLGKRRHKPKVMSDYFLEYDYASPRSHKKSESGSAGAGNVPAIASPKLQPAKASKGSPADRLPKIAPAKARKSGSVGSKTPKDTEKASLEAEIARVRMAAQENQGEQQQFEAPEQQPWQRHDVFSDMPFDDSMFEMTVDVEESPSGHASFATEAASGSHSMAKRKKDAAAMTKEKERLKQKEKLKVKFLKGLLPAPKSVEQARKGKKAVPAAVVAAKKKALSAGRVNIKIAKKKTTKAAKIMAAAAEMKEKKKRGRKPGLAKQPKPDKRITGYSLWAEREIDLIRREHPNVKGLGEVRDLLQTKYKQLSDTERKTWKIMAKRERQKRMSEQQSSEKANKGPFKSPAPGTSSAVSLQGQVFYGRLAGASTSPKGTPSSPSSSRVFIMSPGIDVNQQQRLSFDQAISSQHSYHQGGVSSLPIQTGGQAGYASNVGMHVHHPYSQLQQASATPSPIKRPRGRPPKNARPMDQQRTPQPQFRPADSLGQQQGTPGLMGYQTLAPLPKGLKIPKKESAKAAAGKQQGRPPLKILTAGQRRTPFQVRSPQGTLQLQDPDVLHAGLGDPSAPDMMSHEELVYDSESAALAAAEAGGMDMSHVGLMSDDGVIEEVAYGHIGPQQHEFGEETAAAVSFLTGDEQSMTQQGSGRKSKQMSNEERVARKRDSRQRSRAKQKTVKEQKKDQTPQSRQKRNSSGVAQFGVGEDGFSGQTAPPAAAYEVAYVEPRPSEEETNMFFFGTTQDVQALLEARNAPGPMEGVCRWWLTDDIDPELLHGQKKGATRGSSPPRALTAEPLDAAAVFKLIGRSFETVGNQLMREEIEDSPHEIAAGLDMLLDSLVSSVSHLLTLTGAVPPFDRRYRRDVLSRLVEETSMMVPL